MRIIDCFPFFNEFDLLELRLKELWDVVDYFVISEGGHTQTGVAKPFYLTDHWDRFKPYASKIVRVLVNDMPNNGDPYRNDAWQRNCLTRGLDYIGLQETDMIFVSDCDEIPRAAALKWCQQDRFTSVRNYYSFRMPYFFYKFNYFQNNPVLYHQAGYFVTPQRMRIYDSELTAIRREQGHIWNFFVPPVYKTRNEMSVQHAGWHFTYTGDNDRLKTKLSVCADTQHWKKNDFDIPSLIDQRISHFGNATFTPVALDSYFPKTVLDNQEQYKDYILDLPGPTVPEILRTAGIPDMSWISPFPNLS